MTNPDRGASPNLRYLLARAVSADFAEMQRRTDKVEAALTSIGQALRDERSARVLADRDLYRRVRPMIDSKRIDRQLRSIGGRALARATRPFRRIPPLLVIVCPRYPGGKAMHGGQFVRARVLRYHQFGLRVQVIVTDRPHDRGRVRSSRVDGVAVHRTSREALCGLIARLEPDVVGVHHMEPELWDAFRPLVGAIPVVVWVHGYEARDWRELAFNYDEEYLEEHRARLDKLNVTRRATMSAVFESDAIQVVFVSEFMKSVAERLAGRVAKNAVVIPNVVDETVFRYRQRDPDERRKVLWVRSFAARNYANDLSRDAILKLAEHARFGSMAVTVVGDGQYFAECTEPLKSFQNVSIQRGFVSTERLVELHQSHGVVLVPTRWDSQGLTCLEAMSSGLVPITTAVAAVPEFVPPSAGILCPPDDPAALAVAMIRLQDHPDEFLRRSRAAAEAVRSSCDVAHTVAREAELLTRAAGARGLIT